MASAHFAHSNAEILNLRKTVEQQKKNLEEYRARLEQREKQVGQKSASFHDVLAYSSSRREKFSNVGFIVLFVLMK